MNPRAWKAWVEHWMGKYDVVLKTAAYERMLKAPFESVEGVPTHSTESWLTQTLHLVEADAGCLEILALDADGDLCIPEAALGAHTMELAVLRARVPSIRKYGLPNYAQNPREFFQLHFGADLASSFELKLEDSHDDSGDEVRLEVRMPASDWEHLLRATFAQNTSAGNDLREWMGLHYRKDFDSCSASDQLDWAGRFIASNKGEET